jgi:hypothetical protein
MSERPKTLGPDGKFTEEYIAYMGGPIIAKTNEPRVVQCTIEMNLVEGEHFNISNMNLSDEDCINAAVASFVDMIQQAVEGENGWTLDQDSWVQAKIVEDVS